MPIIATLRPGEIRFSRRAQAAALLYAGTPHRFEKPQWFRNDLLFDTHVAPIALATLLLLPTASGERDKFTLGLQSRLQIRTGQSRLLITEHYKRCNLTHPQLSNFIVIK